MLLEPFDTSLQFRTGKKKNSVTIKHDRNNAIQKLIYPPESQGDFLQLSLVLWLSVLCRFQFVLLNIMGRLVFLV